MDNIKDIIEKARAVVAAHEAYNSVMEGPNKSDRDGDLWDALCAADRALLFHPDARGVLETGDQAITLARLLVADEVNVATLPTKEKHG